MDNNLTKYLETHDLIYLKQIIKELHNLRYILWKEMYKQIQSQCKNCERREVCCNNDFESFCNSFLDLSKCINQKMKEIK